MSGVSWIHCGHSQSLCGIYGVHEWTTQLPTNRFDRRTLSSGIRPCCSGMLPEALTTQLNACMLISRTPSTISFPFLVGLNQPLSSSSGPLLPNHYSYPCQAYSHRSKDPQNHDQDQLKIAKHVSYYAPSAQRYERYPKSQCLHKNTCQTAAHGG
jgi:hypothetical protein